MFRRALAWHSQWTSTTMTLEVRIVGLKDNVTGKAKEAEGKLTGDKLARGRGQARSGQGQGEGRDRRRQGRRQELNRRSGDRDSACAAGHRRARRSRQRSAVVAENLLPGRVVDAGEHGGTIGMLVDEDEPAIGSRPLGARSHHGRGRRATGSWGQICQAAPPGWLRRAGRGAPASACRRSVI